MPTLHTDRAIRHPLLTWLTRISMFKWHVWCVCVCGGCRCQYKYEKLQFFKEVRPAVHIQKSILSNMEISFYVWYSMCGINSIIGGSISQPCQPHHAPPFPLLTALFCCVICPPCRLTCGMWTTTSAARSTSSPPPLPSHQH